MAKKGGAPENMRPPKTKEEAKIRGRNGGIKSGEVRRRKRDAREAAKLILNLPCTESLANNLKSLSVNEEDYTNRVALFARAFTEVMKGDVRAMEFMIRAAGELPEQELDKKRFDIEVGKQEGSNNAIDDWVNSIPDVVNEEEVTGDGTAEKT